MTETMGLGDVHREEPETPSVLEAARAWGVNRVDDESAVRRPILQRLAAAERMRQYLPADRRQNHRALEHALGRFICQALASPKRQ
jgi:hypothetical protein